MLLLAVLADRALHGYAIVEALRQSGSDRFEVSERAVYPALHRLEHQGLVTSSWAVVNGRSRRTYEITAVGRDRLNGPFLRLQGDAQLNTGGIKSHDQMTADRRCRG